MKIGVVLMVILLRRKHHAFVAVQKHGQTLAPYQRNKKHGRKQLHAFHQLFFDAGTSNNTCQRKTLSFYLTASWQGTRGGRRLQQRWQKHNDNDGDNGDGRGRGEKKMVVGGGSCTQMKNVTCSVCGWSLH